MTATSDSGFEPVTVPPRTQELGFAFDKPRDFVLVDLPAETLNVEDPLAFLPLGIAMAQYGAIVFSVAALLLTLYALNRVVPIYGTIWILVLVYVVARLSYCTRMTNSALIQIHPELDEAAQVAGAGTGGVLRSVLLPLLTPSVLYAWIWIALLTYRELTLPVVLATSNNLPFSMLVWSYVQSSSYGRASAAALIMLALMVPFLLLYWLVARRMGIIAPR